MTVYASKTVLVLFRFQFQRNSTRKLLGGRSSSDRRPFPDWRSRAHKKHFFETSTKKIFQFLFDFQRRKIFFCVIDAISMFQGRRRRKTSGVKVKTFFFASSLTVEQSKLVCLSLFCVFHGCLILWGKAHCYTYFRIGHRKLLYMVSVELTG
jgi:hypothetical protein